MHAFEQIEDAVLAALAGIPGLKTLDSYSGQMDVAELDDLTLQFPCIYVTANDLIVKPVNRYDELTATFSLIVGDRNVRGAKSAARGDVSSPGVYDLLTLSRNAVHRQRILDGWTPPELTAVRPVAYAPNRSVCVYEAVYKTRASCLPNT
ncbi:MAG: phage protein Gp37 [Smithellaceae bacterium]